MGLSAYADLICSHYAATTTRCKFWLGLLGEEWSTERGCLQGDPISVACSLILAMVLLRELRERAPGEWQVDAFVDDMTLTATSAEEMERVVHVFEKVLEEAGLRVNWEKSLWTTTSKEANHAPIQCGGGRLWYSPRAQILGVDFCFGDDDKEPSARDRERLDVAKARLTRAQRIPGALKYRAALIGSAVMSGIAWNPLGPQSTAKAIGAFRVQTGLALQGKGNWKGETAKEIFYSLQCPGHRVDPLLVRLYQCCMLCFELMAQDPTLAMEVLAGPWTRKYGLLHSLENAAAQVGMERRGPTIRCKQSGATFDLSQGHDQEARHLLRDFLRQCMLGRVAARRPTEYRGIEGGVDRALTDDMIECQPTQASKTLALRWQCGSWMAADRYARHYAKVQGAICETCNQVETLEHILWCCPKWAHWRTWKLSAEHPCLRISGIVNKDAPHTRQELIEYALGAVALYTEYHRSQQMEGYSARFLEGSDKGTRGTSRK
eukprot:6487162-Amphidinium_carterae.1